MLKTPGVLHTPELLHALASMGNGDEIALVDGHFRAVSIPQRRAVPIGESGQGVGAVEADGQVAGRTDAGAIQTAAQMRTTHGPGGGDA